MIVITTPAGQIGSQVLRNLLNRGEELRVVARDPSGIPADVRKGLELREIDRFNLRDFHPLWCGFPAGFY